MSSIDRIPLRQDMENTSRTVELPGSKRATSRIEPARSRLRVRYAGKVVMEGEDVVVSDHLIEFEPGA